MAKPPRRKRVNLDVECDAFGCRPKSKPPGSKGVPVLGGGNRRERPPEPGPKYDWEVERTPILKSFAQPETDVMLDIEEIRAGGGKQTEKQLFKGTYQEAQMKDALKAAAEASKTFTPTRFPKFQQESKESLLKGGQDIRTISPTAKPGEMKTIGGKQMSTIKEQALRQQLGADYDIAKEGKLRSRTRYKTDPKTGERIAVQKIEYGPESINKMNLQTGRMEIIDLSTGKPKYTKTPTIKVEKKPREGKGEVKPMESIIETEDQADVPESEIRKEQIKAAAEAAKKPGYFSKEAIKSRQRKRRRSRYAQGSR